MTLIVEFFGIPRQRTGCARCQLQFVQETVQLSQVVTELARLYPALSGECIAGDRLAPGYTANLDGERFLSDPHAQLHDGAELLLLSADAGG